MLPLMSHGANLFNLCPFPDSPALYVQNVFPIGPAVWPHFTGFWIVDPLNPPPPPKCRRGVSWGELFLAYVHSRMNPQTCSEFCANRSIRLATFPDLSLWPPKPPPPNAPCAIERRIVFSYVHSQTNPQTCTKSLCQSVEPFDSFPRHLNLWPHKTSPPPKKKPPGVLCGDLYLANVHSQMNPQTWTILGANRSSRLTASPEFRMFDPLNHPVPLVSRRAICLAYIHSQMNLHMCAKFCCQSVQPFDSFNRLLNLWSPKTPQNAPWDIEGRIVFSLCPFPDESVVVYQIWCQSVQLFDSFPIRLNL